MNTRQALAYNKGIRSLNKGRLCSLVLVMLATFFQKADASQQINNIARDFVKLALEIGLYDADYVDAYYGPEELRPAEDTKVETFPYETVIAKVTSLQEHLGNIDTHGWPEIHQKRVRALAKQLIAMRTKVEMLNGKKYSFNEESALLYDAIVPSFGEEYYQEKLNELKETLPGIGSLTDRMAEYRKSLIIPTEKLDAVFKASIDECRKRTLKHINLPENESFSVEYVTDKPWLGYNLYKGNSQSIIQVNTDFPIYIDYAIDLASHEGYPGHHVFSALQEKHLFNGRGWIEFAVYPLFGPHSLVAEGSANYGKYVIFTPEERLTFEKEVLFPLAGLDDEQAEKYYNILELIRELNYATVEAGRKYIDGEISEEELKLWFEKYALRPPDRAAMAPRFLDRYRSYVVNYVYGEDLVKNYIGRTAGNDREKIWVAFSKLLSEPTIASDLVK